MPRLLYVVNIPRFFMTHRLPLALAARDAGYDVHVTTSRYDTENVERIQAAGLPYYPLPLSQHGVNPIAEVRTFIALWQLYRQLKPDIVHHVTIKPVIYGGIAARLTGIHRTVAAMSGLGYVFVGEGWKPRILRTLAKPGFKLALGSRSTHMIFQNPDDQAQFVAMGLIPRERTALIRGSGVEVDVFKPQPEPEGFPVVLFVGRLLFQKGIREYAEAARRLKGKARFVIVGYGEEGNPDGISPDQLSQWEREGIVEAWGRRHDMPDVYAQANIVCLPSYREGLPKVLIEAAACERAIVSTDAPGCREITHDGENGLLVPVGDAAALTDALQRLINDADLRRQMGRRGREMVIEGYSLETVIGETLALYAVILQGE